MLDKSVAENQSATIMILLIINKYLVFEQKLLQPIYYVLFIPVMAKLIPLSVGLLAGQNNCLNMSLGVQGKYN